MCSISDSHDLETPCTAEFLSPTPELVLRSLTSLHPIPSWTSGITTELPPRFWISSAGGQPRVPWKVLSFPSCLTTALFLILQGTVIFFGWLPPDLYTKSSQLFRHLRWAYSYARLCLTLLESIIPLPLKIHSLLLLLLNPLSSVILFRLPQSESFPASWCINFALCLLQLFHSPSVFSGNLPIHRKRRGGGYWCCCTEVHH